MLQTCCRGAGLALAATARGLNCGYAHSLSLSLLWESPPPSPSSPAPSSALSSAGGSSSASSSQKLLEQMKKEVNSMNGAGNGLTG